MKRLNLATLLLPLCLGSAYAQDDALLPSEEEEEIRRYTVEMIIFAYNEDVSVGSEIFLPDPPPPAENALGDFEPDTDNPDRPVPVFTDSVDALLEEVVDDEPLMEVELDVREMYELVMLREDEFTMDEIYGHLERLDVYEPLLHFGWTQPTHPKEETKIRPLSRFVTPPDELGLDGDFQLYLGRYLHLAVNLTMTEVPVVSIPANEVETQGWRTVQDVLDGIDGADNPSPVRYRIQEDRIFKSGETRYFDHPKFGVLAKITRWEEPGLDDLEEEFLGETELLGLDGE